MNQRIELRPEHFDEGALAQESAAGRIRAFTYPSGVAAVHLRTDRVELILLPFHGQQIWSFGVDGENLTMVSPVPEPTGAAFFGDSYGCFLMHCGLTGMGQSGPLDDHPTHGELPTAAYQDAWLEIADDSIRIGGRYHHAGPTAEYAFEPTLTVRPGQPQVELDVEIHNLSADDLRYQYLCHLNWPIFASGRLEQPTPLHLSSFVVIPDPRQDAETARYAFEVTRDPARGNALDPSLHIEPEYIAIISPATTRDGWTDFLQRRPDGRAAWVGYEVAHLPWVVRWIASTEDRKAAGFCMPSTGHHLGRNSSMGQGMFQLIPARQGHRERISFGLLDSDQTELKSAAIAVAGTG